MTEAGQNLKLLLDTLASNITEYLHGIFLSEPFDFVNVLKEPQNRKISRKHLPQ
jgi:hypothetical protein